MLGRLWRLPFVLLLPLAPVLFAYGEILRWRVKSQRKRFSVVTRVERDGEVFTLYLEGGKSARVVLSDVRRVRRYEWGSGVNSGPRESALEIDDRVRVRDDACENENALGPLIDAVAAWTIHPTVEGPHPEEGIGQGCVLVLLGAAVDIIVVAILFAVLRRSPS